MKVVIAAPVPPPYNGTEVMTALLLRAPFSSAIELIHVDTSLKKRIESRGRVSLMDVMRTLSVTLSLLFTCVVHRPKVVYMLLAQNRSGFLRDSVYIIAAKFTGRSAIVRFGGAQFDRFYETSSRGLRWYVRWILRQLDCVIVRSERFKAQFLQHVSPERFSIIPVAIDVEEHRRIGRATSPTPLILFMGMISKAKGATDLLKAVPVVQDQFPQCEFVLAGVHIYKERNLLELGGGQRDEEELLNLLEKYDQEDTVHFPGLVTGDAKRELLRRATLFVCPSYSEGGGPLTALEAMASGIPVIATRVGLLPDYFTHGREIMFVDTGNVESMGASICHLLRKSDEAAQIGIAGQRAVEEGLNLGVYASKLELLFQEVGEGPRAEGSSSADDRLTADNSST